MRIGLSHCLFFFRRNKVGAADVQLQLKGPHQTYLVSHFNLGLAIFLCLISLVLLKKRECHECFEQIKIYVIFGLFESR